MNNIQGNISDIQTEGNLSIVSVRTSGDLLLKSIVIENPDSADYLKIGNPIRLIFKETEVVIGMPDQKGLSLQNKIPATIKEIDQGTLLSKLDLDSEVGNLCSIISTNAVETLKLRPGSTVLAMVKLNEVMLTDL